MFVCICVCVFLNSAPYAGFGTRSIFKWSKAGLNSEFSFFLAE